MPDDAHVITLRVNGAAHLVRVCDRRLLSDCLRHDLGLTATHVGCEEGVCGACTVLVDGAPARSCLLLAVAAQRYAITTVEGLAGPALRALQQAMQVEHGLQCGFCTPGVLTTLVAYLRDNPRPSTQDLEDVLAGNLCRCTGYRPIVTAALRAAAILRVERHDDPQ
ncbi:(2Fe-2S)-binding protein [Streptomyces gardneri]|uniref:(2Fe-2S)-binding protein n=1 Tax=Nocardia sputi TaxID=2943705 RepID=UPI0018933CD8|nr:(2Fe-2S)-binding protein [Nocardia sputi]MBF6168600.1 (2Fe-2S)-binding protein [Streptomyces gardneri]